MQRLWDSAKFERCSLVSLLSVDLRMYAWHFWGISEYAVCREDAHTVCDRDTATCERRLDGHVGVQRAVMSMNLTQSPQDRCLNTAPLSKNYRRLSRMCESRVGPDFDLVFLGFSSHECVSLSTRQSGNHTGERQEARARGKDGLTLFS